MKFRRESCCLLCQRPLQELSRDELTARRESRRGVQESSSIVNVPSGDGQQGAHLDDTIAETLVPRQLPIRVVCCSSDLPR